MKRTCWIPPGVSRGVVFYHPLAVQLESIRRVFISKGCCYVLATEEGCSVFCRDGVDVGVLVGKDGDVVHQLFSFVELLVG